MNKYLCNINTRSMECVESMDTTPVWFPYNACRANFGTAEKSWVELVGKLADLLPQSPRGKELTGGSWFVT